MEQRPNFEGNRGTKTISGDREHKKENTFSIFGEQGNKPNYFRGTREQVLPWEGLSIAEILHSLLILLQNIKTHESTYLCFTIS